MKTIPLWVFEFVSFIHNPCCPFAPRRSIGRSIAVCLCIYECVYVCYAYVYMYVYAYVYMYVCMYVCIYVTILVYAYVCVYICMHMCSKTSQQQGLVSHLANSFASEVIDTTMLQCFTSRQALLTKRSYSQTNNLPNSFWQTNKLYRIRISKVTTSAAKSIDQITWRRACIDEKVHSQTGWHQPCISSSIGLVSELVQTGNLPDMTYTTLLTQYVFPVG